MHLYEVRDAISAHYGSEAIAQEKLGVDRNRWKTLGRLANAEPLEQGRPRGKYVKGRRPAERQELTEARITAQELIVAFARTL